MEDVALVPLTGGHQAIVDATDFDRVAALPWSTLQTVNGTRLYGCRTEGKRCTLLHRYILNAPDGMQVDHINGDSLDNRRANLRVCTASENIQNGRFINNKTGYRGVFYDRRYDRWGAEIYRNGKKVRLGWHKSAVLAAKAYDEGAKNLYGEHARLNFTAN